MDCPHCECEIIYINKINYDKENCFIVNYSCCTKNQIHNITITNYLFFYQKKFQFQKITAF